MTITAQLPDLLPDDGPEPPVSLAAQALGPDAPPASVGAPVPDDPTAVSMFTAHRLDDTGHHLAHATERMQAARAATGELRAYHSGHVAFHLQRALDNGHRLTSNIRAHYPAEAAELEQVKQAVGLARSLTPEIKAATTAHLLETTLHEETHGVRHAEAMADTEPDDVWAFNADHCAKHLGGAVEHAGKLAQHFRDNYPDVAKWLDGLDEITSPAEEAGDGKPQHARYAKSAGTVSAQMANGETISGQVDLAAWEHEQRGKGGEWASAGGPKHVTGLMRVKDLTPNVDMNEIASDSLTRDTRPIMVEHKDGVSRILNGNHRYKQALARGDKEIPVNVRYEGSQPKVQNAQPLDPVAWLMSA